MPQSFSEQIIEGARTGRDPDILKQLLTLRPRNRSVAILGDSRVSQSTTVTATEYSKLSQGFLGWAQFLTNQRFDFSINDNFGVSGNRSNQAYDRIPSMLRSTDAGTVIVLVGTNDPGAGFTALGTGQPPGGTDTIVNLQAIADVIRNDGRLVIFLAEMPRGDSTNTSQRLTTAQLKQHMRVRQYLLDMRNQPGVYVADPWKYTALGTSTTGDCIELLFKDGLHPNATGAYYMALALKPILEGIFPPIDLLPQSNSDVYDATLNPYGCLNANPMMDGTGGTKNTAAVGNLADSWSETGTPGFTRTYSKVTGSDGRIWQQCVNSGTATSSSVGYRQVITASNLTIGDKVQAVCDFESDADFAQTRAIILQVLDNSTINARDLSHVGDANTLWPNIAMAGVMRTPVYTLTTTTVQIQIVTVIISGQNPTGTFRVGRCALRKVP